MVVPVTDLDADERAELERLRSLVGPSEVDYATLRADVVAASEMAKQAELEAGRLRAHVEQMSTDLWRARQDQDHLHRVIASGTRMLTGRIGRSVRARLF